MVAVIVTLILAVLAGFAAHWIIFRALAKAAARDGATLEPALAEHIRRPSRVVIPIFFASVALSAASAEVPGTELLVRVFSILLILGVAWLLLSLTGVVQDVILSRHRIDVADNLAARKVHTQVDLIRKIVIVIVVVVSGALVLMSFEPFRVVGTGLLASAGIAGLVLGLAAQKTLGNLLAGFQIALTQPIRLDDVVVVEGEWGKIEDITLTYVVVRIWDLRRLILPISYFIESPFQNWTRTSATVLGTVFLHVDYTVPVEDVRTELRRLLEGSEEWDRDVCVLHVTEAGDRTVELRALMSAADSGLAWELRCKVREGLLEYLRREHPEGLPRVRAEMRGDPGGRAQA